MNRPSMKGRGTSQNPANRFERLHYSFADDDPDAPLPKTQFFEDHSKSIIATNDSPDVPFDASINVYRGCEHGCVYCYARPTHEYLGFSSGLDFESKILVKKNAKSLLHQELSSSKWTPQVLGISGVTDAYQPIEKKLELTRSCLDVLAKFRNPVGIITKNALVTRDIDHLKTLAQFNSAVVYISVTTLKNDLSRVLEPRASAPKRRLETIRTLHEAGIPVGVLVAPIIPGLTDTEIPEILSQAQEAGTQSAGYVILRLPHGLKDLFESWLEEHFPQRKSKVLNRIRSLRSGDLNNSQFGSRMAGQGEFAKQIQSIFQISCLNHGLSRKGPELSTEHFRRLGGPDDFLTELFGFE